MVKDPKDPGTKALPGLALSNRDKQAAFKARQRAEGKLQRTWWVTPEEEKAIQALLDSPRMAYKRRGQRNRRIVEENRDAIRQRREAGEKPTAIAKWLHDEFGFEGTGATLNGFLLTR